MPANLSIMCLVAFAKKFSHPSVTKDMSLSASTELLSLADVDFGCQSLREHISLFIASLASRSLCQTLHENPYLIFMSLVAKARVEVATELSL